MEKICKICGKSFIASKYRLEFQIICSDPACQRRRQLENMKQWRKRNPHYFKQDSLRGEHWRQLYKKRIKRWRKEHPDYFKQYREKNKIVHKDYMREYMRRYRTKRRSIFLQQEQQAQQQAGLVQPPLITPDTHAASNGQ